MIRRIIQSKDSHQSPVLISIVKTTAKFNHKEPEAVCIVSPKIHSIVEVSFVTNTTNDTDLIKSLSGCHLCISPNCRPTLLAEVSLINDAFVNIDNSKAIV